MEEFLDPLSICHVNHQNSKGNCQMKLNCYEQLLLTTSREKKLKIEVSAAKKNINCVNPWKDEMEEECNLDRLYPTQNTLKSKGIDIQIFKWKIKINFYMQMA